jgi:hypothetical protein
MKKTVMQLKGGVLKLSYLGFVADLGFCRDETLAQLFSEHLGTKVLFQFQFLFPFLSFPFLFFSFLSFSFLFFSFLFFSFLFFSFLFFSFLFFSFLCNFYFFIYFLFMECNLYPTDVRGSYKYTC